MSGLGGQEEAPGGNPEASGKLREMVLTLQSWYLGGKGKKIPRSQLVSLLNEVTWATY